MHGCVRRQLANRSGLWSWLSRRSSRWRITGRRNDLIHPQICREVAVMFKGMRRIKREHRQLCPLLAEKGHYFGRIGIRQFGIDGIAISKAIVQAFDDLGFSLG